jgi:carnitine-CoA ligase
MYEARFKEGGRVAVTNSEPAVPIFSFASLPSLEGRTFTAPPFAIEQSEARAFESITWIDRVYTEPDPPEFPENILEGFHTLAMLDAVQKYAYRLDPRECYGFNYGLNHVRFPSQISIGDQIASSFEIRSVKRRGEGYLVVIHCEFRVVGAEKPGLVAEWVALILPRAGFELDELPADDESPRAG